MQTIDFLKNRKSLAILTIGYFILELLLNYQIYKQLSYSSSSVTTLILEHWGKIISGCGLALFITRLGVKDSELPSTKSPIIVFLVCAIICIPVCFWFQNWLINYVTNQATDSDKNKALLILATHSTLVPHYDIHNAVYTLEDFADKKNNDPQKMLSWWQKTIYPISPKEKNFSPTFYKHEANFYQVARRCTQQPESNLYIHKGIDKAFFSYISLNNPLKEKLYKEQIKVFYTCLYNDPIYYAGHAPIDPAIAQINSFYSSYRSSNADYNKYAKYLSKDRLDNEWRKKINEQLGFSSTLPPNLSFYEFIHYPDVKRYFFAHVPTDLKKEIIYPYDKDYPEKYKQLLISKFPDIILTEDKKNTEITLEIPDTSMPPEDKRKQAYKAIVMPVIGIGMSAFFLILNVTTVVCSLVHSTILKQKKYTVQILWLVAMLWLAVPLFIPLNYADGNIQIVNNSKILQWIYYHESHLAYLYEAFLRLTNWF